MRWRVEGAWKDSGSEGSIVVAADDRETAIERANLAGLLAESVFETGSAAHDLGHRLGRIVRAHPLLYAGITILLLCWGANALWGITFGTIEVDYPSAARIGDAEVNLVRLETDFDHSTVVLQTENRGSELKIAIDPSQVSVTDTAGNLYAARPSAEPQRPAGSVYPGSRSVDRIAIEPVIYGKTIIVTLGRGFLSTRQKIQFKVSSSEIDQHWHTSRPSLIVWDTDLQVLVDGGFGTAKFARTSDGAVHCGMHFDDPVKLLTWYRLYLYDADGRIICSTPQECEGHDLQFVEIQKASGASQFRIDWIERRSTP